MTGVRRWLVPLVAALIGSACGPSEAEIQGRIDDAVSDALSSTSTVTTASSPSAEQTTNPGATCRDYHAALVMAEMGYDDFVAIEQRIFQEVTTALGEQELGEAWLGEYVEWSAEQEVASAAWKALSDARPPAVVAELHVELLEAAWDYVRAGGDVWGATALTMPFGFGTTSIPTAREWDQLLSAYDEAYRTYEDALVLARAACPP